MNGSAPTRALLSTLVLLGLVGCTGDSRGEAPVHESTSAASVTELEPSGLPDNGQSQSFDEAARDKVPSAIAKLSEFVRIGVGVPNSSSPVVESSEGTWIVSRPKLGEDQVTNGCIVGDFSGQYGIDYVCVSDYVEVLLLEHGSNRILKAYPFPETGPQNLFVTEDAIYCMRQGDGASPDSMMCRIDRKSLARFVRVFPYDDQSRFLTGEILAWAQDWAVNAPVSLVLWESWSQVDGSIVISGYSGSAKVDATTLELSGISKSG